MSCIACRTAVIEPRAASNIAKKKSQATSNKIVLKRSFCGCLFGLHLSMHTLAVIEFGFAYDSDCTRDCKLKLIKLSALTCFINITKSFPCSFQFSIDSSVFRNPFVSQLVISLSLGWDFELLVHARAQVFSGKLKTRSKCGTLNATACFHTSFHTPYTPVRTCGHVIYLGIDFLKTYTYHYVIAYLVNM